MELAPLAVNPKLPFQRRLKELEQPLSDLSIDSTPVFVFVNAVDFLVRLQNILIDLFPRPMQTMLQGNHHLLVLHTITVIREGAKIFELLIEIFDFFASWTIVTQPGPSNFRFHSDRRIQGFRFVQNCF